MILNIPQSFNAHKGRGSSKSFIDAKRCLYYQISVWEVNDLLILLLWCLASWLSPCMNPHFKLKNSPFSLFFHTWKILFYHRVWSHVSICNFGSFTWQFIQLLVLAIASQYWMDCTPTLYLFILLGKLKLKKKRKKKQKMKWEREKNLSPLDINKWGLFSQSHNFTKLNLLIFYSPIH